MYREIHKAFAFLLLCSIVFSTLCPATLRPGTGYVGFERWTALALFGTCFGIGFPRAIGRGIIFAVLVVGGLEILQDFVPGRHGRMADALIKSAGALTGLGCAAAAEFIRKAIRE